jgi:hypothetical protein
MTARQRLSRAGGRDVAGSLVNVVVQIDVESATVNS